MGAYLVDLAEWTTPYFRQDFKVLQRHQCKFQIQKLYQQLREIIEIKTWMNHLPYSSRISKLTPLTTRLINSNTFMELSNRWVLILPTNMLNYGFCMATDENSHIPWKPFYFWWSWLIKVANCITSQLYGKCWMSTLISCSSWGALMSTSIWQAWLIWLCDKLTKRYQMICWSMDISKNSGGSFSRVIRFISSWSLQFYKSKMIILFFLRWWLIEFRDGGESSSGSSTTGYRERPDSCGGRLTSCPRLSFLMSDIDIREQQHQIWRCSTEILLHVCIEAECPIRWVLDWLLETSAGAFFASQIGLRQLLLLKISPVLHHSIFDLIIFISTLRGKFTSSN